MQIADATFVVTDTETTGTKAKTNRIIEIGAVKLTDGEVVDRFQQLVNPQRSVPSRITKLTGITTGMVFEAPTIDEVLPEYLDFLGDDILAAHNLPFDERFLNRELERTGRRALENETLCTLRLARRLLPGLNSKGLTRLAQFYGVDVDGRHRALGDAEATAIVLKRFFAQLDFEHEIDTVDELLSFQHRSYKSVRRTPNHLKTLREEVLPEVPDRPGVYFFKSSSGKILYIGKAKRLSDRVRSYFNAIESHSARKRKLMQKVRDVDWQTTDTELEAVLEESRLIKEHKPYYNRAQRRYYSRPFLRLDTSEAFPRLTATTTLQDDGAEYYGPLRNRDQAEFVLDLVGRFFRLRECDDDRFRQGERCLYADMDRCPAPCETGDEAAYADAIDEVRAALTGRDRSLLDRLKKRMEQAAQQREYEKAAEFRDAYKQMDRMLAKQAARGAPVLQHNAALVHRPGDGPRADVLLVRFGRFVESVTGLDPAAGRSALRDRLEEPLAAHFGAGAERPDELSRRAVDEIRHLSHWMYKHRDDLASVRWEGEGVDAFAGRIADAVAEPAAVS
jgi:DNA polymerase-3 subunit epsilon